MPTREFTEEFLIDVIFEDNPETELLRDEIYDQRRWDTSYDVVFSFENKFYNFQYSRGSTEYQDNGPEIFDTNCTEVEEKEVLVKQWVAV